MKCFLIKLINLYQNSSSSTHGLCKFYPTCSEYTKQAINEYGCFKGIFLGIKRILRCNPFTKGGYDPVPIKKGK